MDVNSSISALEDATQVVTLGIPDEMLFRLVGSGIFVLLAIFATRWFRWVLVHAFYRPLARFMPEWVKIILRGFDRPVLLACRLLLLFIAVFILPIPVSLIAYSGQFIMAGIYAVIGWGFWRSSDLCTLLLSSAQNRLDLRSNKTLISFFSKIYRVIIVAFTMVAILDAFGLPITGLLTGAGIAGVAVSLGAQSTLSNLLAGVMLVLEHPFGIDDYIIVGSVEGYVENISFRSTRIRTLDNAHVTLENSAVSSAAIYNVSERSSRKWDLTIGVKYDTPRETLDALCPALLAAFEADPAICSGETDVWVSGFAASSIDVSIRCYTTATALRDLHAVQSRLNRRVMDVVHATGCDFAFPSTSVYFETALPGSTKQ